MNEIFSFSRFKNLFIEHWSRNWRIIITIFLVGIIFIAINLVYSESSPKSYIPSYYNTVQETVFQNLFTIGLLILSLGWAIQFTTVGKKINYFMLPASALEKMLLIFIWLICIYGVVYFLSFYLVNIPVYEWAVNYEKKLAEVRINMENNGVNQLYFGKYVPSEFFNPLAKLEKDVILSWIITPAIIISLSLKFKIYALVKTILLSILIMFVLSEYFYSFIPELFNGREWNFIGGNMIVPTNHEFGEFIIATGSPVLKFLYQNTYIWAIALMWALLAVLIKEKEV